MTDTELMARDSDFKTIKAVIVQMYPETGNIDRNSSIIKAHIEKAAKNGAALLCFPECALTGYSTKRAVEIAVDISDRHITAISEAAKQNNITVSFGFVEKDNQKLYISHIITGSGGIICYRKTHLGTRERDIFTQGDKFPIYNADGMSIGVCLCWEAHIPEIAAVYRAKGINILLTPYASGMKNERCLMLWSRYLPARASDNGIYVIACNGLESDSGLKGNGIAVYDPKGEEILSSYGAEEESYSVVLDGPLPRNANEGDMHYISYFDRRRPWLYDVNGDRELFKELVDFLKKQKISISSAESLTGGMVASHIVDVPGASSVFAGGLVTYSDEAKERLAGVPHETIREHGAISFRTAAAMAEGTAKALGTDMAVSTTGNAGPDAAEGKRVGLVYIGVYFKGSIRTKEMQLSGCRDEIRRQTAREAALLCLEILKEKT